MQVLPSIVLFVADAENYRVQVFKLDGTFLRKFGDKGSGKGLFALPRGITVSSKSEIAVADRGADRISVRACNVLLLVLLQRFVSHSS